MLWRQRLLEDIKNLERFKRRATRFILERADWGYRERLEMLPISMWLELHDVVFLVKQMKFPSDNFNVFDYVCKLCEIMY